MKEQINTTYSALKKIKLLHHFWLLQEIDHEKHIVCCKDSWFLLQQSRLKPACFSLRRWQRVG